MYFYVFYIIAFLFIIGLYQFKINYVENFCSEKKCFTLPNQNPVTLAPKYSPISSIILDEKFKDRNKLQKLIDAYEKPKYDCCFGYIDSSNECSFNFDR